MTLEIHVLAWYRHNNVAGLHSNTRKYRYKQTINIPAQLVYCIVDQLFVFDFLFSHAECTSIYDSRLKI